MRNKTRWFIGFCCLILVGGAGLMLFYRNERQRKEQELVKMETTTAKQIKNTFADVKEIEFSEEYVENDLAGFTSIDVTITTKDAVVGTIGTDFSPKNKAKTLESYVGGTEFKKGITKNEVKVIFSDKSERSL